ncbi:ubiquitin-associated protein 2-like isoform X4 [Scleropages formosus]|uniref:ubiquitin-associated protein 2-like isoform X4 n=1 Tax=Scleropages formosus TaxID=113540 RepID=UPI0008791829|nr:ubiquitin-associated protein 2-like isoform X4 [Scleropages formosus]
MMTSVGSSRARGSWEQTQTQNQTQHKQRPQATAEQIRLAQMISDHNDADFEEKVKQLIDITGKDQDESMIALHDCNGDINRAINVLLEGSPDTDSWEMVGKKKGVSGQKESGHVDVSEEGKENRDRGGERDVARRRGGAPRRGRGASRGREFRGQENGLDGGKVTGSAARGTERGRRGRGRGGRGGSGRRGGRFSSQAMGGQRDNQKTVMSLNCGELRGQIDKGTGFDFSGDERTFNPADYAEPAQADESYAGGSTWNNTGSLEPDDSTRLEFTGIEGTNYPRKFDSAPGAWRTAPEEWGTEDWNEDLSETKIFTASSVAAMSLPQESVTITAGQRIDLAVLLGKTPPSSSSEAELTPLEASQPPSLSQALVFNNSKQGGAVSQPPSSAPYTQHSMASMLSKSFGDVVDPKATSGGSTSGSQFLEQFKTAQALAQLAAQHTQTGSTAVPSSSWDTSASLGQYDMKSQPEATVHGPFTKRQPYQPTSSVASSMIDAFLQEKVPPSSVASSLHPQTAPAPTAPPALPLSKPPAAVSGQQMSPVSSDNQSSSPQPLQQHKLKQQKKRTSISTKIPALAVEMPGTADISGLNLQFGALQFGSEPVLTEYEVAPVTTAPASQTQSSLYTSASSEPTPTIASTDQGYQSSSLPGGGPSYPSQAVPTGGAGQPALYEQRATQTRRYPPSVSTSPQKDLQTGKNGFSSIQTTQSVEATPGPTGPVKSVSDSEGVVSVSNMPSLADSAAVPVSLLTTPNQTSLSTLGHSEDLPPGAPSQPQHSSSLSTQQNSLAPSSTVRTTNSSLLHSSVDSDSSLHSSSFPSSVSAAVSSTVSVPSSASASAALNAAPPSVSTVSAQPGLGPVSSLNMGLNSSGSVVPPPAAAAASSASATVAASSSASSRSSVASSGKAPPNLPPGVPPLLPNPYIMAPGLLHAYPPQVYGYDDLQMLQTRIPLDYYSIPFATPTTALTGREGSLTSNPYSAELTKFGRGEAPSPAPATTLAQPQQSQTQTHHTTQQPFLNPALPPGYSYTSLPYYTGVPGLPNTFQYGPAVFPVAPTSSKQHGVNVSVNASATPFQQASGYGSHGYGTGYEDMGQASGSGDFCKGGYSTAVAAAAAAAASAQNKPASSVTGPGVGVSVTSSNTGVPDISGSVYTKTQSFDKQGFHAGTPAASFSLPSALGSGGPINPPAAAGYAPAPFMHILAPHQQPHSQILHHHLQQDGQSGTGQRSQNASLQQKSQVNKSAYNSYNWGAN